MHPQEDLIRQVNEGTLVNDDRNSVVSPSPTLVKSTSSDGGQSLTGGQSADSAANTSGPAVDNPSPNTGTQDG